MQLFKFKENQMAKKLTRAEKIRRYIRDNPTAKTVDIAAHFETRYQNVYAVRRKMDTAKIAKEENWKTLGVFTSDKSIAQLAYEAGKSQAQVDKYWKAVGEVQKAALSPERIAELTAQAAKPKARMQSAEDNPQIEMFETKPDTVNHPAHYKVGGIETIDFIEAKNLGYNLGNVVKYITRADHKGNKLEDLRKAQWYLTRAIETAK